MTGETLASEYFIRRIEQAAFKACRMYHHHDVGLQSSTFSGISKRILTYLSLLVNVAVHSFSQKSIAIYLVCPGGKGIFLFAIFVIVLRQFPVTILCHHHGRKWIERSRWFLHIALFHPPVIHLTQCEVLALKLKESYPSVVVKPMSNAAIIKSLPPREAGPSLNSDNKLNLGYISNLTFEKGVDEAVRLIATLSAAGHNVHLHIAGAPQSPDVENFLKQSLDAKLPITLWGFVDPTKKAAFFEKIDVLIFPTRYALETEPLVTLEALSYGRPVIAHGIGCIGRNLFNSGGISVSPAADFCTAAANQIALWQADPTQLHTASRSAQARFTELQRESADQILVHIIEPLGLSNPE